MNLLDQLITSIPSFHTAANVPYILDQYGRARIFHGTNFIKKEFPWYPSLLLEEENIAELAAMGMNTVRLSLQWTGAEPMEGEFNSSYYEITNQIIDNLLKYDIYPFLDVHQDVMSTYFCLYDGFPTWAVDKSTETKHEFPWPLQSDENGNVCPYDRSWARNYLTEGSSVAFQSLYDLNSPLQNSFRNFWSHSAEIFAKKTSILGYEIINEPWAGDIYTNPLLLTPGQAGKQNLLPFYDQIVEAIRIKDSEHLIFYEPVTWGMIFNGEILGSGFDHVPGGNNYQNASVFSFHYYCWWYNPETADDFTRKTCDKIFGPKVMEQVIRDTKQIGGGVMLTEWGQGCDYDTENPYNATGECNAIMALCDEHLISWTDWYFGGRLQKSPTNEFNMTENARAIFSRTYAKAIAGRLLKMNYDVTTRRFELCFEQLSEEEVTSSITEIFVPLKIHYPNGVNVNITSNLKIMKLDEVKSTLYLTNQRKELLSYACVDITPKEA